MIVLARLIFMAITLFMFINLFLDNIDDRKNSIAYKIYLFLFVFIIQFLFQIFTNLINTNKIAINVLIETSINNSLLAVIAFDVYNDLVYNGFYKSFSAQQKTLMLVLLIISFMAVVKILQLLISSN